MEDCEGTEVADLLADVAQRPEFLYHYTDGAALINICASNILRATSFRSLNDITEIEYGLDLLEETARGSAAEADVAGSAQDTNHVLDLIARARTDMHSSWGDTDVFVACASAVPDDLSQWRGYGPYAIKLRSSQTFEVKDVPGDYSGVLLWRTTGRWQPVIYNEQHQRSYASDVIRHLEANAPQPPVKDGVQYAPSRGFYQSLQQHSMNLVIAAAHLKHPSFQSEQEYRLVFSAGQQVHCHRAGAFGLTTFIEVTPEVEGGTSHCDPDDGDQRPRPRSPHLVTGVTLGPGKGGEEPAARSLLNKSGLYPPDVKVDNSVSPFR